MIAIHVSNKKRIYNELLEREFLPGMSFMRHLRLSSTELSDTALENWVHLLKNNDLRNFISMLGLGKLLEGEVGSVILIFI